MVAIDGTIFNNDGSQIESTQSSNGSVVELAWLDGVCDYSVGMLVIITYHPMYLPEHLWNEVEPLYIDGNPDNNHSDNLTYRFKCGILQYEADTSFFYIPHYTKYVIDRRGVMLSADTGREKIWSIQKPDLIRNSKGGYFYTRVVDVPGSSSILLRHRALCLTFKAFETAATVNLIVNHLDGIPGNDTLENLEWVTYARNNKHAHDTGLTGGRNRPVLVKDLKTGCVVSYKNTKVAAKTMGHVDTAHIRFRLRHRPNTLFDDYLQFKLDDDTEWQPIDLTNTPIKCDIGKTMAARDVFTGSVVTFSTFDEGAKLTGVDKQTIMIHIRDRQYMPFRGYNFSYYADDMAWPEHTERHLKAYKLYPVRTPDPVILTDRETGNELFFESRNEMADFLNISRSYATQIVLNNWVYASRYVACYYLLRENIKVPSDWKV